jgi:hypothetical protein
MSDTDHIFQATGDSCPVCTALDGQIVPAGYTAHDNCQCQTIPKDEDSDCTYDFEHVGNTRDGSGSFDVVSHFEVEVTCPDGSSAGASSEFDGHGYTDLDTWADAFEDAAEDLAAELCESCPHEEPFLCS